MMEYSDEMSTADQSMNSMDIMRLQHNMKAGNLNSSFRGGLSSMPHSEEEDGCGSSSNHSHSDGGSHRGSMSSRGSRGSRGATNNKGGNSLTRRTSNLAEEHVDMPHLDDILRSVNSQDSTTQQAAAAAAAAGSSHSSGGPDHAAGGRGDAGSRVNWADSSSAGSGSKGSKSKKKKSPIIIQDDDGEDEAIQKSLAKKSTSSRSDAGDSDVNSNGASNSEECLDKRLTSFRFAKSQLTNPFESLWGGGGNDDKSNNAIGDHQGNVGVGFGSRRSGRGNNNNDYDDDEENDDTFSAVSDESLPMRLMRSISGSRTAFMRGNPDDFNTGNHRTPRYYGGGGNCCGALSNFVKSHGKLTALCVLISIGLAATIGALVVMVPLWMDSEERGESGELGGLAYGGGEVGDGTGGGVMMDNSQPTIPVETGGDTLLVDNSPANEDVGAPSTTTSSESGRLPTSNSGISTSPNYNGGSNSNKFKPPPYNLSMLCSKTAVGKSGGYEKCAGACLPSQCCLVSENKPYEVWTVHKTSGYVATAIGTVIHSCFKEHADQCVQYYNQCSSLGTTVLLPRKPPTRMEVDVMNNSEKLELAEWINHSCSKVGKKTRNLATTVGGGESECQMLCHAKECCFVDDDEQSQSTSSSSSSSWSTGSMMQTSNNEGGSDNNIPDDDTASFDMLNARGDKEDKPDTYDSYGSHPTITPSKVFSDMPTPSGSSYLPTPTENVDSNLRRRRSTLQDEDSQRRRRKLDNAPELGHMEIPGDEDFVFLIDNGAGTTYPGGGQYTYTVEGQVLEPEESTITEEELNAPIRGESQKVPTFEEKEEVTISDNCVADPQQHCMTYHGCAPLFRKG